MSNEFETIIYTHKASIATIKLNRLGRLNAINQKMGEELLEVLHECKEDNSIKVVVITGEGNVFCGGGDIKDMKVHLEKGTPEGFFELLDEFHELIKQLKTLGKPTICGVNGIAYGAGMNFAFHCDFIVAVEDAVFNEAFLKIGLSPDSGGSWLLPRLVGIRRAMEILVLSEDISAGELPTPKGIGIMIVRRRLESFCKL